MKLLETASLWLNRFLLAWAGVFLLGMIGLTCANIVSREVWRPVPGSFELMGFAGAVVAALALGTTQMRRGHIAVDVLVQRFPRRIRRLLAGVNHLVCGLFFGLITWRLVVKAATDLRSGVLSETLRIVYYPFVGVVALGAAAMALVFLVELLRSLGAGTGRSA
jgi:TRAP-type C4-dicarboxylate transport system permease small subunit